VSVAQAWPLDRELATFHTPAVADERGRVLIAHGLAEHFGRYDALCNALATRGYAVYGYDQRAHGRSPGRARALVDIEQLVDDHLAARAAVTALGTAPLFLFGHSMGGLVTARSAQRDGDGLAGVALSSPALNAAPRPADRRPLPIARLLARIAPATPMVPLSTETLAKNPDVANMYKDDPLNYLGKVRAGTIVSMIDSGDAARAEAAAWTVPLFVVHGSADRLCWVGASRAFVTAASAHATVVYHEIEGGYHELFNDDDADSVTGLLLDWLDFRTERGGP
jgi:alpha-beta hydrolase superfamily lysophospholipase